MYLKLNKVNLTSSLLIGLMMITSSLFSNSFIPVVNAAPPPDEGPLPLDYSGYGGTNVTTWWNNLPSAVSITYDDSTPNQANIAAPEMTKRGLVGTFFAIIDDVTNWTWWQNVSNHGHELGSHTVNHVDLTTLNQTNLEYQLRESKRYIEENISGIVVDTICYPFGAYDNNIIQTAKNLGYISGRRVWHLAYNSPDISWLFEVRPSYFNKTTAAETMNHYINRSIENNGWAVEMLHAIKNSGDGYEPIPVNALTAHFNFVKQKKDEGKIWVDTFKNVSKYISERLNATIDYYIAPSSGNITVNLSTPLDNQLYNQILTLKTELPANWTKVYIRHMNGTISEYFPVNESGRNYVYYNVPNKNGSVRISNFLITSNMEYAGGSGFIDSYFSPAAGDSQQDFIFRVNVTSPENISLEKLPDIIFDINGDGDIDDTVSGFVEGGYTMLEENAGDLIYTDGKIFNFSTKFPPGSVVKFRFDAVDVFGRNVSYPVNIGLFVSGPVINNPPYPVYSFMLENNHTWTPRLLWECAPDPDGDKLRYNISIGTIENASDIYLDSSVANKSLKIEDRLEFNRKYFVSLQSTDARNLSSNHSYYNFTLINYAPSAPSGLRVQSNKTLTPKIMWNSSVDFHGDEITYDLRGFYVEFNESMPRVNFSRVMFDGFALSGLWFNVTSPLPDNSTIKVNLTSRDFFNASSTNISAMFHFNIPPSRITTLSAQPSVSEELAVDINWYFDYENVTDWKAYQVYRSTSPFDNLSSGAELIAQFLSNKSTNKFTDTELDENVTYYYAVIPVDTSGERYADNLTNTSSKPSPYIPPEQPPPPIAGVSAEDVPNATNSINLSWTPSSAFNLWAYRIYRSLSSFSVLQTDLILVVSFNRTLPTYFIDKSVENNITYFYAVTAYSASGLENTTSFELAWAVSIYDITVNNTNNTEEPGEEIDIEFEGDVLYDAVLDMTSSSKTSHIFANTGHEQIVEQSGASTDNIDSSVGEYHNDFGYGETGPVNDNLIDINSEPERIKKFENVSVDGGIDDNLSNNDDEQDIGNINDTGVENGKKQRPLLESAIIYAWFTILITTVIIFVLYILDRRQNATTGTAQSISEESIGMEEEE